MPVYTNVYLVYDIAIFEIDSAWTNEKKAERRARELNLSPEVDGSYDVMAVSLNRLPKGEEN